MRPKISVYAIVVLFASICYAQSGWYAQNSGTSKFLLDVHFIDQNSGWICGQTGTVLHTSDGGANWTDLNAPPNNVYYGIYFVSDSVGWVVGSGGDIIHTTDCGSTWTMQPSPTQHSVSDVFFVNADTGWAVGGKARTFTDPIREVSYTTNGGTTWSMQYSGSNEEPLGTVYFLDKNNGWAVGGFSTIMHTSDGGANWSIQMSGTGYEFEDVYFVNPDTGYVVGQDLSLQHYAVIFKTVDGGTTWNFQTFGSDDSFQGVQFVNESTGWVVGGSNTSAIILNTTDGGANWTPQNPGTSNFLSGMHFADENNGWAVGFNGTIVHTTTGGVVGIEDERNIIPDKVVLYNNYPNPFNPTTTIRYDLAERSRISLSVYNVTGEKIRTLVNDVRSAGSNSIVWDGKNDQGKIVSSGVYVYQLQAEGAVKTKKMIFLK